MLSRTNLTLSALARTNGLNLGTRSLAAQASVNTMAISRHSSHPSRPHVRGDDVVFRCLDSQTETRYSRRSRLIFPDAATTIRFRVIAARCPSG